MKNNYKLMSFENFRKNINERYTPVSLNDIYNGDSKEGEGRYRTYLEEGGFEDITESEFSEFKSAFSNSDIKVELKKFNDLKSSQKLFDNYPDFIWIESTDGKIATIKNGGDTYFVNDMGNSKFYKCDTIKDCIDCVSKFFK